ncbi:phosphotransferase [Amycolatopsis jiangsuensis]|uniref:Aminoglycoside phosphotransferase (APT) family kinase protein n=1 Tax=Amycolatopsis jiangsuensis TaxID=1181879 RepID=A0A840IKZ8_9PSEU|nr:phosphotransferase [Amycolatopsis jiangsuensis]MBB4682623.1 aminoglycoside phosphotransferase (APT) family kinase protein [Amycolatopsis jiangsuensis]
MTAGPAHEVLIRAAQQAGINVANAELIRDGANVMYRLPHHIVARIGPAGSEASARQQVQVARWLAGSGIPVTTPLGDVPQPAVAHARPVTWWRELPDHRAATPAELGSMLHAIHQLPIPPQPQLPEFNPFDGIEKHIEAAGHIARADREWLLQRATQLRTDLSAANRNTERAVIHGDAWQGNVAVPFDGNAEAALLDLDRFAVGAPAWDLIPLAVDYTDFARIPAHDYHQFVTAYGGHDVTTTPTFRPMADLQELRWVAFVLGKADNPSAKAEAQHRIACLRGDIDRPWLWTAF